MRNLIPILKQIKIILSHKYFVFVAGLKLKVPLWNLIVHDLSKLTPSELPHYARQLCGEANDLLGFSYAFKHHCNHNPHRWDYWVMTGSHPRVKFNVGEALPMKEKFVREMLADWLAVEIWRNGKLPNKLDDWQWFLNNIDKVNIHPQTREIINTALDEFFDKQAKSSS